MYDDYFNPTEKAFMIWHLFWDWMLQKHQFYKILESNILGRENSKYKGHKAEKSLLCEGNRRTLWLKHI